MSRTYKTDPLWLQLKKNRKGDFPMQHHHELSDDCVEGYYTGNGYSRYGTPLTVQDITCYPYFSYYQRKHLPYRHRPAIYSKYAKEARRRTRGATRNTLATAKYLSRDDLEDFDLPDHEFHHGAIWWLIY